MRTRFSVRSLANLPAQTRHAALMILATLMTLMVGLACDSNGNVLPTMEDMVTPTGEAGSTGQTVTFTFGQNPDLRNHAWDELHWNFGDGASPRSLTTVVRSVTVILRDPGAYNGMVTPRLDHINQGEHPFTFEVMP